jgi:hypothetical protein
VRAVYHLVSGALFTGDHMESVLPFSVPVGGYYGTPEHTFRKSHVSCDSIIRLTSALLGGSLALVAHSH